MTSYRGCTVRPLYCWIDGEMKTSTSISIDKNGSIIEIGNNMATDVIELKDQIWLPGFVNAHSHAFHRHLRGRSEIGGSGAETFWKWRDNMYALVDGVEEGRLYRYCLVTFQEMLAAGITTVGEFHYVHHGTGRFDLDQAVIRAANDSGIRICLIQTLYERAGFDDGALHPVQERFVSCYEEFIENLEGLLKMKSPTVTIGVAAHSARAVPFENIQRLFEFARERDIPFHIHLEEQPKEIADCMEHFGKCPSDVILSSLPVDEHFTAVHSTYTPVENMKRFAQKGVNVCITPCTEGYLGDGIANIVPGLPLSFGTDCNNRIAFLEEMRWACFSQQMKNNSRSVAGLTAKRLLESATTGGARSLRLDEIVGKIQVGMQLDVVSLSARSLTLSPVREPSELLDSIVFGCGNREISQVIVSGDVKYNQGVH